MRTASSARPPRTSVPQRDGENPSRGVQRLKCSAESSASLQRPPRPLSAFSYRTTLMAAVAVNYPCRSRIVHHSCLGQCRL
jgi:hypothetical protein